jgi:hypothetical protein
MYRKPDPQLTIDDFILPFSGKLSAENRWVKLAKLIPWDEFEKDYAFMFPSDRGNVAKPVRMALGSLIIQTRCGYTDRELVQQITENPYLQYFIGLKEYQLTPVFTPVALVKFRKRFKKDRLAKINERIIEAFASAQAADATEDAESKKDDDDHDDHTDYQGYSGNTKAAKETTDEQPKETQPNQGILILDATCVPADIKYPTDLGLLNEAREKLEEIIDTLHRANGKQGKKPRTYRQTARKVYLSVAKQRNPRRIQLRQGIKRQLQYCKRNLRHVEQMLTNVPAGMDALSQRQKRLLNTIRILIEQQDKMYKAQNHRIEDRIVSLYQPHVRPIVRGKVSAAVEFGAKVAISIEKGMTRIEKLSWDAFNEAGTLIESVNRYKDRHGYYPEALLADQIYRNRENLAFCKANNIRLSGPRLGRPAANVQLQKTEKALERLDARMRNAVEGKFGEGKRKYHLNRSLAKLKDTAESVIAMHILVMNLEHQLRVLFVRFLQMLFGRSNVVNLA